MINNFRRLLQEKLNAIPDLYSGEIIGDDMIEEDQYYFGYNTTTSGTRYNLDYSDRREIISITGYLSTKGGSLEKFDNFTDDILDALAKLRLLATATDIPSLDNKVRKVLITGYVFYNSIDGLLKS